MLALLYAASALIPIVVVARFCLRREGLVVNPILTFSIGFVVYWLVPIFVGTAGAFSSQPGMDLWYSVFDRIGSRSLVAFAVTATGAYVAFVLGYVQSDRRTPAVAQFPPIRFAPVLLEPVFVALVLVTAVFGFALRGEFFHGYTSGLVTPGVSRQGSFIAVSLALFALALLRFSHRALQGGRNGAPSMFTDGFFLAYFAVGVLALSLGGRLYMVSTVLMLAAYRSTFEQPLRYRSFLAGASGLILLAGVVGVIRLGGPLQVGSLLFNLAAEPVFTSFSLISFLSHSRLEVLRFPIFLASDFVNLIPTALLPTKSTLLLDPWNYGFEVFSPLGALNSYFSFMINFGALGTILVLYLFGAALAHLRRATNSAITRTSYSMITGWLAFTFFRDPFSISIVKNIFEFSIVMPVLFAVLAHVLSIVTNTRPRAVRDESVIA